MQTVNIVTEKSDLVNLTIEELANKKFIGMEVDYEHYMLVCLRTNIVTYAFVSAGETYISLMDEEENLINFLKHCRCREGVSFHVFESVEDFYDWMKLRG